MRDLYERLLFAAATGEDVESMQQALRLAWSFERDLLHGMAIPAVISCDDLVGRFGVSDAVADDAIQILQHRQVLGDNPTVNGSVSITVPSTQYVLDAVCRHVASQMLGDPKMKETREAIRFVTTALPPHHPGQVVAQIMNHALDRLHEWHVNRLECRAARTGRVVQHRRSARGFVDAMQLDSPVLPENELCRPSMASRLNGGQATRIIEPCSCRTIQCEPDVPALLAHSRPGPLTRLIALWMHGNGLSFRDVLAVEHPLRIAIAMLAMRRRGEPSSRRIILNLQRLFETAGTAPLIEIIEMEKNISWLTGNCLLDLMLRTMTVYKIARASYATHARNGLDSYIAVNRAFLYALLAQDETGTERHCSAKNSALMELDLRAADRAAIPVNQ